MQETPKAASISKKLMIGSSLFGGGSALYLLIQLAREQPDRAFRLLQSWGPGYLLALFIAFVVNKLLSKAMDGMDRAEERGSHAAERGADAVNNVADQMRRIAESSHAQAIAMQAIADKDDRDKQEMQTLVGVVNSKVDQTLEEQKRQNRALMRIEDALKVNRPEGSENT